MRFIPIAVCAVLWISAIAALMLFSAVPAAAATVREPAVAGKFYPADPAKLRRAVSFYLAHAVEPDGKKPVAIVAPHAGYVYSGQICADAWAQARDHDYDLVIILGTNHTTAGFSGVSIVPDGVYRTPLGDAKIDERISDKLTATDPEFSYRPAVHRREHSVEVQVPFVQVLFPDTPVVIAVIGTADPALCERFGRALARAVKDRNALIVASSDLSHYPSYEDDSRKRAGEMPPGCDCARVVLGKIYPNECRLYGKACTPRNPVGPCMVSDEGACRIWWASGVRERKERVA